MDRLSDGLLDALNLLAAASNYVDPCESEVMQDLVKEELVFISYQGMLRRRVNCACNGVGASVRDFCRQVVLQPVDSWLEEGGL